MTAQSRTLVATDSLQPGLRESDADDIPPDAVAFEPKVLAPDQTSFRVVVDGKRLAGQPGGLYTGPVEARTEVTQPGDPVDVWIVIP